MTQNPKASALFIGLTTLDLIYYTPIAPTANQKKVATDLAIAAGGPATNAAVVFAALGGTATVMSVIGCHPLTQMIQADLTHYQVKTLDLDPTNPFPPCLSSITVSLITGDRSIISRNAQGYRQRSKPDLSSPWDLPQQTDLILVDGHQIEASLAAICHPEANHIPVVLDGGSWKPGLEKLLPFIDYMICSANFYPPACGNELEVVQYLHQHNPQAKIAITHGEFPITAYTPQSQFRVPCPLTQTLDTLGAGDFFHGAFCAMILQKGFKESLKGAAQIASQSCQTIGPREWLSKPLFNDIFPFMGK